MVKWSQCLVLILAFFASVASAQPIYEWRDEKGQLHFSNFPPAGVVTKKLLLSTPGLESVPAIHDPQAAAPTSAVNENNERLVLPLANALSSDVAPATSERRWLLIFPPITKVGMDDNRSFPGWSPVQLFNSDEACNRAKSIEIANSLFPLDSRLLNSNCIPASEFVTGKEADVVVISTQFELVAKGFSSHFLSGKVFNRGQATARKVEAEYQIRTANGSLLKQGEVATNPNNIPSLTFAEFRTGSIGGWSLDGVSVKAKADWSNK